MLLSECSGMANILIKEAGFIPTSSTITTGRTVSVSAINDSVLSIEGMSRYLDYIITITHFLLLASSFRYVYSVRQPCRPKPKLRSCE